jgi:hypothetical protein
MIVGKNIIADAAPAEDPVAARCTLDRFELVLSRDMQLLGLMNRGGLSAGCRARP